MFLFSFAEDTLKMDKILQFLDYNKFPLVTVVNELNSARVYSSPIKLQVAVISDVFLLLGLHFFFLVLFELFGIPFLDSKG